MTKIAPHKQYSLHWFQIAMKNVSAVHVLKRFADLGEVHPDIFFRQVFATIFCTFDLPAKIATLSKLHNHLRLGFGVIAETTTTAYLCDNVKIASFDECIAVLDNVRVIQ